MKTLYTVIIFLTCSIDLKAQFESNNFKLTFEDTNVINQVFYADSIIDSLGIWQIGVPNKPFFDSAYSPLNAIMTGLDSALQPGSKASFIISLIDSLYPTGGFLTFVHKFQFDSALSGGYVQYSLDTGKTWFNVSTERYRYSPCTSLLQSLYVDGTYIFPPSWAGTVPSFLTHDSIPYFSGTDSVWIQDTIAFPQQFTTAKTSSLNILLFRFTAFADSLSEPLSGWIIDNIKFDFSNYHCGSGINEINSAHLHVYPDPATDEFFVSLLNEPTSDYEVTLYDLSGKVVMRSSFTGQEITMRRSGLDPGSYFIQLMDQRTQNTFQKRIVFE